MLNREQVTEQIRAWSEAVQEAEFQLRCLSNITGDLDYDAPLPKAVMELIDGYTAAISKQIGDEGGWLKYFREECDYGAHPMDAVPDADRGDKIKIDGQEALARVIFWDREHGEAAR